MHATRLRGYRVEHSDTLIGGNLVYCLTCSTLSDIYSFIYAQNLLTERAAQAVASQTIGSVVAGCNLEPQGGAGKA